MMKIFNNKNNLFMIVRFFLNNRKYFKNCFVFTTIIPSVIILCSLTSLIDNGMTIYAIESTNSSSTAYCINNSHNPIEEGQVLNVAEGTLFFMYQCVVPYPVHVGDYFTIYALVWPITHNDIEIEGDGPFCGNPLTVQFNKNVKINEIPADDQSCKPFTSKYIVNLGQWLTLSTSPFGNLASPAMTSYLATSPGKTNGTMELKYREVGNSSLVSIKEPFEITIEH